MTGTERNDTDRELLTLPQLNRETGIGLRALRRALAAGDLPAYSAGTAWPRIRRSEFDSWIESTRVPVPKCDREQREMLADQTRSPASQDEASRHTRSSNWNIKDT